jgi:two-component system, chemotaxis family, response regulator WspR
MANDRTGTTNSDVPHPTTRSNEAALEAARAAFSAPPADRVTAMVLLVDDQAIVAEAVRRALIADGGRKDPPYRGNAAVVARGFVDGTHT